MGRANHRFILGQKWSRYNIKVNKERYRAMISDFLVPKLEEVDVDDLWFQ